LKDKDCKNQRLIYQFYGLSYDDVLVVGPMMPFTQEEYEEA